MRWETQQCTVSDKNCDQINTSSHHLSLYLQFVEVLLEIHGAVSDELRVKMVLEQGPLSRREVWVLFPSADPSAMGPIDLLVEGMEFAIPAFVKKKRSSSRG